MPRSLPRTRRWAPSRRRPSWPARCRSYARSDHRRSCHEALDVADAAASATALSTGTRNGRDNRTHGGLAPVVAVLESGSLRLRERSGQVGLTGCEESRGRHVADAGCLLLAGPAVNAAVCAGRHGAASDINADAVRRFESCLTGPGTSIIGHQTPVPGHSRTKRRNITMNYLSLRRRYVIC